MSSAGGMADAGGVMAELGRQTVDLHSVLRRAAEDSYLALKELVESSKAGEQSDAEKKIGLLKFILKTRQRMLRLLVLSKWCQQVPLVQYCQQLSSTLSNHDTCFTQAADSLFFMHEGLQQARAPIYDVPSAVEVLLSGSCKRLPKCIEDLGVHIALTEVEQKPALKQLDILLRSKLLEISLPKEISKVTVSDGSALLSVDGEFKVLLTLGYRGHLALWRILHLELLVGEKNGAVKLEEMRRHALGDDLERRMATSDDPLMVLYSILHEFCVALIMDTVIRQVKALRLVRWKDAIHLELIYGSAGQGLISSSQQLGQEGDTESAALRTPGVRITYWIDSDRNLGGPEQVLSPFVKIEPGPDMRIRCMHSSFVIDPATGKEAEFALDQSCIDIEKLLLRVIKCNKHTRLLEIYKDLGKNSQICQTSADVLLKCPGVACDAELKKKDSKSNVGGDVIDEVLHVRAYGSSYITLGINIRTGRFLLQASRNVLVASVLLEFEEALNQGSMSTSDVFVNLRSKSILLLFASIGRFLGLKVYEQVLAAVIIPKALLNGLNVLLMGFPQCSDSYYLLIQLDKDFKPLFKLLGTHPDVSGEAQTSGNSNQVIRSKDVDISQMQMVEDELNLSLLDWEKLLSSLSNVVGAAQPSEHGLISDYGTEDPMRSKMNLHSSFSAIVDEVFDLDRGPSVAPHSSRDLLSSLCTSFSHVNASPVNYQGVKTGLLTSPEWDSSLQVSQSAHMVKVPPSGPTSNSLAYTSNTMKSLQQLGTASSYSHPVRCPSTQRLPTSKFDKELTSLKSHSCVGELSVATDEDQLRILGESQGDQPSRLSQLRVVGSLLSKTNINTSGLKTSSSGQMQEYDKCVLLSENVKWRQNSRKRMLSDILQVIPSMNEMDSSIRTSIKRRKVVDKGTSDLIESRSFCPSLSTCRSKGYSYGRIVAEASRGCAPQSVFISTFLHVVRHCSLCIKHAQLTSQMEALDIPYVEEVGVKSPSSNLWFRLPFARDASWHHICLRLGKPGSMIWHVKVNDQYFSDLWDLQKGNVGTLWGSGVRIANTSDVDSHIRYDSDGVVLMYRAVEVDSIKKMVADLKRLFNARVFALGMRKLLGVKGEERMEEMTETKVQASSKIGTDGDKVTESTRRAFRIESVGLMSLWFSFGFLPGVMARFVVEWEAGKEGCTVHVSPDQLWPHTKFLEDFINGAEVAPLLDCIRLTAGPLLALAGAIRPARMTGTVASAIHNATAAGASSLPNKPGSFSPPQGLLQSSSSFSAGSQPVSTAAAGNAGVVAAGIGNHNLQSVAMLSVAGRGGPGIVPSSLLPIDVSVVLRGPYWIRIIYRKHFAVDMRCFAGDQVWLQPATPPKGGPSAGGSLPCPQFRPFIMEHVAQGLNALEPIVGGVHSVLSAGGSSNPAVTGSQVALANGNRLPNSGGVSRPVTGVGNQSGLTRVNPAMLAPAGLAAMGSGLPLRIPSSSGVPVHVRGELNTAFIGLGDDGGYGGGWVPVAALKKVLRGILKYLGVLWLFAQLPDLLKEILGSILKENEGALLNLDQEQPALRFFVGGHVFAVSVHRVQLLLQVLSVKRFHHQQQQQQQQSQSGTQEELTYPETSEICDYFSRRVASEPYDASRVASFITLLTLPISVLREFLKLIAWKKGQSQGGEIASSLRPRIELSLENHSGWTADENFEKPPTSKSNIRYDRSHSSVDFGLTVVLDPAHIPHVTAAGGAAWLPYCVSVTLRYLFGDNPQVSLLGIEGSHGGRACWARVDDWEVCKQRVARSVAIVNNNPGTDSIHGRLRIVAETIQRALHVSLQHLRDGSVSTTSAAT